MQNKKLIISLFSLCLVAIVGLLATVIVFAATSQNIESKISINYTATEVAGSLKVEYKVGSNESVTVGTSSFTAITTAGTLDAASPELSSDNPTVVFTYTFTNNGGNDAKMTLTDGFKTKTNMTFQYSTNGTEYSSTLPTNGVTATKDGGSASIYVKLTIADTAKNVGISGLYTAVITKA